METRAPFVVVGAFVLAAIVAVFSFVYWLHNTGGLGPRATYHVQFDGSVPGLLVGAAVLFNGIRVGEVTDLGLAPDSPRRVNATISVASTTPVRSDTKVGVEFQGLTGVPVVALEGGMLQASSGEVPTLIAEPGAGQSMTQAGAGRVAAGGFGAGGEFRAAEGHYREPEGFLRGAGAQHRKT
jgi:ABC-type transport system involved in resistance to organic solvents, periplasmic component